MTNNENNEDAPRVNRKDSGEGSYRFAIACSCPCGSKFAITDPRAIAVAMQSRGIETKCPKCQKMVRLTTEIQPPKIVMPA